MARKLAKPKPSDENFPHVLTRDMGNRIRQARDDASMSQAELAEKICRRQASISEMENGKMDISATTLSRVAIALKKPISFFFPPWIVDVIQPEETSPEEAELLSLAKQLPEEDILRFIVQVRAVVQRNKGDISIG